MNKFTFLLIICKMIQLISAGTYILNEKAFKHNLETKRKGVLGLMSLSLKN